MRYTFKNFQNPNYRCAQKVLRISSICDLRLLFFFLFILFYEFIRLIIQRKRQIEKKRRNLFIAKFELHPIDGGATDSHFLVELIQNGKIFSESSIFEINRILKID